MRPGSVALGALGALILGCGSDPQRAPQAIYAPWEAGLTLTYEDPRLPAVQRAQTRRQVRVAAMKQGPDGLIVERTLSTLQGYATVRYRCQNGGVTEVDEAGVPKGMVLPAGFPDKVDRWQGLGDGGTHNRLTLLGRAAVAIPGLVLPATVDPVGVWMESEFFPPEGRSIRRRSFLLSGIGETETWEWEDHTRRWICINRLVARGFTDLPTAKSR